MNEQREVPACEGGKHKWRRRYTLPIMKKKTVRKWPNIFKKVEVETNEVERWEKYKGYVCVLCGELDRDFPAIPK